MGKITYSAAAKVISVEGEVGEVDLIGESGITINGDAAGNITISGPAGFDTRLTLGGGSGQAPLIVTGNTISGIRAGGNPGDFAPQADTVILADGGIWIPNNKALWYGNSAGTTFQRGMYRNTNNEIVLVGGGGSGVAKFDTSGRIGYGLGIDASGLGNMNAITGSINFFSDHASDGTQVAIHANDRQSTTPVFVTKDAARQTQVKIYAEGSGLLPEGIIIRAPNGSGWLTTVDNDGVLTTEGPFIL